MQSPFVFIIFGATGDLAKHKLLPALFTLFQKNQLPKDFYIIGFARRELSDEQFAGYFAEREDKAWQEFAKHLSYQQGMFDEKQGYEQLVKKLAALDEKMGACITRIFYLATPPQNYETILDYLNRTKLAEGCGQGSTKWTRIAIEKPFGKDLETAKMLDEKLATIFEERQIFRVDHYLGKETVQNILAFRFANGIFDPIWNNTYIDHVQITFAEKKGITNRGKFYDGVGELRDVAQNHLLQLLASVAMEMPASFSKEGVRNARAKAIKSLKCFSPKEVGKYVVRGQYVGYTKEKDVDPNSKTETFVAMKVFLDEPRFYGVPFYVRAGKAMSENVVTISLVFKQTCHILFKEIGCPETGNIITIRIQPNEGISIQMIAKSPGSKLMLAPVDMHFLYDEAFKTQGSDAYEKVLTDIFTGDQMLFNRSDELESSWDFITKTLKGWEMGQSPVHSYMPGSFGPQEATDLIEKDGRKWV